MMEAYDGIPVTSQITPYVFEELFQAELAAGTRDLILLLINSKGSATYFNAVSTRERFYRKMRAHRKSCAFICSMAPAIRADMAMRRFWRRRSWRWALRSRMCWS